MNITTLLGTGCLLLTLGGCVSVPLKLSQETPAPPNPLIERIENMTATGYAVIAVQNHRNPAQQRLMAIRASKLDAYRSLTEQIYGLQLDANATVADMVVTSDSFRSKVQGVVYGATLVSITPVGEDTYETTLSIDKNIVLALRSHYLALMSARAR
ncbi:MAG: LPP20 family lipoprotein [Limnohabitans sp.]|jgi:outer membrane protein FlgP